jgi:hypothetical protein
MFGQQSAANAIVPLGKVHAQTTTFKGYVPFPFVVGNRAFPAGIYQIQRLLGRPADTDEIGVIAVRNDNFPIVPVYGAVVTNLIKQPPDSRSSPQLVFARRAGRHYLSEVRIAGEKGHRIPNTAPESELAGFDSSREEVALAELH